MITPRATRLVRVANLQAFREAAVALAREGSPADIRDRLVVVPTRAAAAHLLRSLEDALGPETSACLLPDFVTPREIVWRFADRLPAGGTVLSAAEREVVLGLACRVAREAGCEPPFHVRPALVAEILEFYDELQRNQQDVDTFERLALSALEPGASHDRGAERLVRQTRFLVAAFRDFARRVEQEGLDEHALRDTILTTAALRPIRHVVLTVADTSVDVYGLPPADWDLLTRVAGLERLDVIVTDRVLAGALHERLHSLLPGIEEVRFESPVPNPESPVKASAPSLAIPSSGALAYVSRDREEEVATFARRVKELVRSGDLTALDRAALVVQQPLPYMYVAREVLRSAGIPCQLFDALPLAAEPYAAALDTVFSFVSASFARGPAVALLRSPHFSFTTADGMPLTPEDIALLDAALSESGYLGDADALDTLIDSWRSDHRSRSSRVLTGGETLQRVVGALRSLCSAAPVSQHLQTLLAFLTSCDSSPAAEEPWRPRHLRARAAILGTLESLRIAYARFDATAVVFDDVTALVRRWIDSQTFSPRSGEAGVHVVDAASAVFGQFDHVQLAGLVDGEWPARTTRSIFYSPAILRDLGWSPEPLHLEGARAAFADLFTLPTVRVAVSTFLLEADALVTPSPFLDEVAQANLEMVEEPASDVRIFDYEALALDDGASARGVIASRWAAFRARSVDAADVRFNGGVKARKPTPLSLSALERYQDCPFKFFASEVLRLAELPEDEDALSPRARGRFIHEVFERFFTAWDEQTGNAPIAPERAGEARGLFAAVAEPLLARLPDSDAALERARLFGSAVSVGIVDTMLALEADSAPVVERWLEHRFEGVFSLGAPDRRVALKGVADRIDVLEGNRLRVIDYKTGAAPNPKRALQVAAYALCAQETLSARDGGSWRVETAAYIAFSGKRSFVPVVKSAEDAEETLNEARTRLFALVDGIERGEFPPRPHDPLMCRYCAYPAVCRKDYVDVD